MDFFPPTRLPLAESVRLGAYHLLRRIDEGGMSTVYLAYDEARDVHVAIKILSQHLAEDPANVSRFIRESSMTCRLHHPNLVRGIESAQDPETQRYYLVLEYIDGRCAQRRLDAERRLPLDEALRITRDIASALEYLHQERYVHRDIKPGNILIDREGHARLIDLGLAKRITDSSRLTQGCETCGTPYYMSFEQGVSPASVDGRSDLFALGATLYHLICGEVPFPGREPREISRRKLEGHYLPISHQMPELSIRDAIALDGIIKRLLARDPSLRYRTARELITALDQSELPIHTGPMMGSTESLLPSELVPIEDALDDLATTRPNLPIIPIAVVSAAEPLPQPAMAAIAEAAPSMNMQPVIVPASLERAPRRCFRRLWWSVSTALAVVLMLATFALVWWFPCSSSCEACSLHPTVNVPPDLLIEPPVAPTTKPIKPTIPPTVTHLHDPGTSSTRRSLAVGMPITA